MNNISLSCSLNDTTKLRNLILENPQLPLLIFCGEEVNDGDYPYEQAYVKSEEIKELTLYNNIWMDKDDYEESLSDNLCDEEEYKDLSDYEYEQMIEQKVAKTEFVKAIVIYVG
ncbi:MAG: hypothetical protein NC489_28995 [Ruminococcus flavefaciens]|nr:hypothetical protein [Ruminococcus flavefaciens]